MATTGVDWLKSKIRDVPDWPEEGVVFKDIMPLLADRDALRETIDQLGDWAEERKPDIVVGGEAREQLARVFLRERRDGQPRLLAGTGLDDVAFLLQALQRAPDRGPAHAETRGDVGLDDARAGRQASPDDQLAQLPVGLRDAVAAACIGLRGTPDRSGVRAHVQSIPGS